MPSPVSHPLNQLPPPRREDGIVAWFHAARGFGFITSRADDVSVFVSHRDLTDDEAFRCLASGDRVTFSRSIDEHGPVAVEVERIATAGASATVDVA